MSTEDESSEDDSEDSMSTEDDTPIQEADDTRNQMLEDDDERVQYAKLAADGVLDAAFFKAGHYQAFFASVKDRMESKLGREVSTNAVTQVIKDSAADATAAVFNHNVVQE